MYFFNNCVGRNYVSVYGIPDAFYDLYSTGFQGSKARHIHPGDTCVVATAVNTHQIRFTHFRLARVEVRPCEDGTPARVFCGSVVKSETVSKGDAARDGLYSVFFDKNGNFKRQSVLQR